MQKEEDGLPEQQDEYWTRDLEAKDNISKIITTTFTINKSKCATKDHLTTVSFHVQRRVTLSDGTGSAAAIDWFK